MVVRADERTPLLERAVARLWSAIDEHRHELVALVGDLVRLPSPLGQEAAAQAYVAAYLRDAGLAVQSWDLDDALRTLPEGGDSGVPFVGRPNVAGVLAGAGGGRSLILNGHIDVVSPEPLEAWTHDPWAATIADGRMYGRGAFDMKSGIAINLFLTRLLRDLDLRLRGDLTIQSVIEEECTGAGSLDMSRRFRADAALVTEPEGLRFTWAHLGVLWFRVRVTGRAVHAMIATEGVNAIVKTLPLIAALQDLERRMNERSHPAWQGVAHPINLNIGAIRGGDWPSTVPGACEMHCRVAFFPGQTLAEVRASIEAAIAEAARPDPWLRDHPPSVTYDGFQSSGSLVSLSEPSVRTLERWHRRTTGGELQKIVGTSINDMRYFNLAGIPAGCYGATGGNGHGADEWLDLASLVPAARAIGGFLLDWCGVAD